ncbi:Uncharacterised protein [Escherichia coli]|nr:Uncharacterised protein [Escherichia coli]
MMSSIASWAANGFRTFNLGNNFRITSCIACQATGIVQIFAAAWEGDSQVIYAN